MLTLVMEFRVQTRFFSMSEMILITRHFSIPSRYSKYPSLKLCNFLTLYYGNSNIFRRFRLGMSYISGRPCVMPFSYPKNDLMALTVTFNPRPFSKFKCGLESVSLIRSCMQLRPLHQLFIAMPDLILKSVSLLSP